ncbi:MAG: PrsW family intramembrane metalloprotease, partial [Bacteroidetes bacterium]|nr:PrsW family intramembrane metalloprotease [Bacteroidota bacterium]
MDLLILLALSLAPGVVIIAFIYIQDKHEKEPAKLLIQSFFLGVISIAPAIALETIGEALGFGVSSSIIGTAIFAFLVVGFSEEFSKFIFLDRFAYPKPDFNEPFDGIVYAVMISMGFATAENIMYVVGSDSFGQGVSTGLLRMFTA